MAQIWQKRNGTISFFPGSVFASRYETRSLARARRSIRVKRLTSLRIEFISKGKLLVELLYPGVGAPTAQ